MSKAAARRVFRPIPVRIRHPRPAFLGPPRCLDPTSTAPRRPITAKHSVGFRRACSPIELPAEPRRVVERGATKSDSSTVTSGSSVSSQGPFHRPSIISGRSNQGLDAMRRAVLRSESRSRAGVPLRRPVGGGRISRRTPLPGALRSWSPRPAPSAQPRPHLSRQQYVGLFLIGTPGRSKNQSPLRRPRNGEHLSLPYEVEQKTWCGTANDRYRRRWRGQCRRPAGAAVLRSAPTETWQRDPGREMSEA